MVSRVARASESDLAKGPEISPAGRRALAAVQQEDLGQAQQEEHGAQENHALLQLHLRTRRRRRRLTPAAHSLSLAAPPPRRQNGGRLRGERGKFTNPRH